PAVTTVSTPQTTTRATVAPVASSDPPSGPPATTTDAGTTTASAPPATTAAQTTPAPQATTTTHAAAPAAHPAYAKADTHARLAVPDVVLPAARSLGPAPKLTVSRGARLIVVGLAPPARRSAATPSAPAPKMHTRVPGHRHAAVAPQAVAQH